MKVPSWVEEQVSKAHAAEPHKEGMPVYAPKAEWVGWSSDPATGGFTAYVRFIPLGTDRISDHAKKSAKAWFVRDKCCYDPSGKLVNRESDAHGRFVPVNGFNGDVCCWCGEDGPCHCGGR